MDQQPTSQAGPSSTGSGPTDLHEKYKELDSIFPTQPTHHSSATKEDELGETEEGFVSQLESAIEYWCSMLKEETRKNQELDEREKSLQELHDKQQQMILHTQMEVEQISSKLDAAIRNRETLEVKVQHACGIGSAMRQHCESVNLSMSQISTLDDDLVKDSAEILEIVSKIMNDGNMTKQFEELEEVQRELLEYRREREIKEKEFQTRREFQRTHHEKRMAEIQKETVEVETKLQSQKLELAAAKHRREVIQKRLLDISKDEEIDELKNTLKNLEMKTANSIESRLKPILEENICLSSQSNELQEEISALKGRLEAQELDKISTEKQMNVLHESLSEANIEESNLIEKLNTMRSKNLEIERELVSYRNKIEDTKSAGQKHVSQLETKLLNAKQIASNRSATLKEDIAVTKKNFDVISERCEEKRNALSVMTSQFESLQKLVETAQETQCSLDSQLRTTDEENNRLSCVSQDLMSKIETEEKNQVQLKERLSGLKLCAEEKENAIKSNINATKDEILRMNESIASKTANIALLQNKLEEVQKVSLKSREQDHLKYNSVIDELHNKIAQLDSKAKEEIQKHQTQANELTKQLEKYNQELAETENVIANAIKTNNRAAQDTESLQSAQKKIQLEIDLMKTSEDELVEKCKVFERNLQDKMRKQAEIASCLQDKEQILLSKTNRKLELEQQIDQLEKNKTEASVRNCDEMKEIMHRILETKQICESLFSSTNQLNSEINDVNMKCDIIQKEYDSKCTSLASLESEIARCNSVIANGQDELNQISKATEKSEKKIRLANREKLSADQMYDTMLKGVAAAKAKKVQAKDSSLATTFKKSPARDNNQRQMDNSSSSINEKDDAIQSTQGPTHSDSQGTEEGKPSE